MNRSSPMWRLVGDGVDRAETGSEVCGAFIQMERPENPFPLLTPHGNSFQMDQGLSVEGTSLRLLEENVKEYLYDLRVVFP